MTSNGYKALLTVGAKTTMKKDYRGSFALIGFSGNPKPGFVKQVSVCGVVCSITHLYDQCFLYIWHEQLYLQLTKRMLMLNRKIYILMSFFNRAV